MAPHAWRVVVLVVDQSREVLAAAARQPALVGGAACGEALAVDGKAQAVVGEHRLVAVHHQGVREGVGQCAQHAPAALLGMPARVGALRDDHRNPATACRRDGEYVGVREKADDEVRRLGIDHGPQQPQPPQVRARSRNEWRQSRLDAPYARKKSLAARVSVFGQFPAHLEKLVDRNQLLLRLGVVRTKQRFQIVAALKEPRCQQSPGRRSRV